MRTRGQPDKIFLAAAVILVLVGLFVFLSASFGLLTREGTATFFSVAFNQFIFGLVGGGLAAYFLYKINPKIIRKYSPLIFLVALGLTALTLMPGVGVESGGARRWLDLGFVSFQPSEFLKLAFILFLAALYDKMGEKVKTWQRGILPLIILIILAGLILISQPNTGNLVVILISGISIFFAAGGRPSHAAIVIILSLICLGLLVFWRPYLADRIVSFVNPSVDPLGSSYQVRQALVTVGSGALAGRGFGQSIQKFEFLPEPIGDSIFAVLAEEFGFIGSTIVVLMFAIFAWRGLNIARRTKNEFARLTALGIVIMITAQSFLNISAMLGVLPIAGLPLLFISHGGTALFFTLAEVGLVLNISRYQ